MSSARICECLPQECVRFLGHLVGYCRRLTRSSTFAMAHISSGNFARVGRQNLPQETLCSRPLCTGSTFRAACASSRSHGHTPADITTSKLSPSVRADNTTKSCPSISADVSTPSSAVTTSCDSAATRQSSTHVREHTRHVVLHLLGPHVKMFSA